MNHGLLEFIYNALIEERNSRFFSHFYTSQKHISFSFLEKVKQRSKKYVRQKEKCIGQNEKYVGQNENIALTKK